MLARKENFNAGHFFGVQPSTEIIFFYIWIVDCVRSNLTIKLCCKLLLHVFFYKLKYTYSKQLPTNLGCPFLRVFNHLVVSNCNLWFCNPKVKATPQSWIYPLCAYSHGLVRRGQIGSHRMVAIGHIWDTSNIALRHLVQNYEFVELSLNSNKTPDQMGKFVQKPWSHVAIILIYQNLNPLLAHKTSLTGQGLLLWFLNPEAAIGVGFVQFWSCNCTQMAEMQILLSK